MDDLRIYTEALPPNVITALANRDLAAEARYLEQQAQRSKPAVILCSKYLV